MARTPATLDEIAGLEMALLVAVRAWATGGLARREVLPLSTGGARVLPNQTAQITAPPQREAFRPERLVIRAEVARDFLVQDIVIGNRSQFLEARPLSGELFVPGRGDGALSFETAQTAMDVWLVVTYVGSNPEGEPFDASFIGTTGADQLQHAVVWTDGGAFVFAETGGLSARRFGDDPSGIRVEKIDGEDLDEIVDDPDLGLQPIDPPRVVGLRVRAGERALERVLFAVDDAVGKVVFEIFVSPTKIRATIDLDGYVPEWLLAPEERAQKKKQERRAYEQLLTEWHNIVGGRR